MAHDRRLFHVHNPGSKFLLRKPQVPICRQHFTHRVPLHSFEISREDGVEQVGEEAQAAQE
eukprot:3693684-Amphidinium_carterae.1